MPVAVNQPRQREEKDPLDTILKGLQIANGIFGIKADRERAALQAQKEAREADKENYQQAINTATLEKAGFQAPVKDEATGKYSVLRRPDYDDLEKRKTEAEIKKLEAEAKRRESGDPMTQLLMEERLDKMRRDREEAALKKTPEGRLSKLPSSDKQRLDNAKLGLSAVQGMASALQAGDNTFSIIGDNDFTQQRTLFEESLGRMQSGGAITKDEERRFRAMAPTFRDPADIQQKKLIQLQQEFTSRLGTLGFSPQDLGVAVSEIPASRGREGGTIGARLRPPAAQAAVPDSPKPGTIDQGYRFRGGDPSDPKSWELVK